jgi:hypothetical protein
VATFATPPDGQPGNMQVYIHNLHDALSIDRDAALDAQVIIHELTHGLSNRLVGNSTGLVWRPGAGLGEGWSDFYALAPLGGTVTITIRATIKAGAGGATIGNQGTITFDADGDGVNESGAHTDNPATSTSNDPTVFRVLDRR